MKNIKRIYFTGAVLAIAIIAILIFSRFSGQNHTTDSNENNASKIEGISFPEGLQILDSGIFKGTFVEDGTDEDTDGVMALTVANNSDKWLEYAELIVATDKDTYHFSISALPSHAAACVLEEERKLFETAEEYDIELQHVVFYDETPSLHKDVFEIEAKNQQITVKNISDKDITGNVYVYYKLTMDDGYLGGIAYRAKIENGLAVGEEKACYAGHYWEEASEILFVTYVE